MNKVDLVDDMQFVFGAVLIVANRMDTLLERELKQYDVTSKQWFLSIVLDSLFENPPTIKEVAREMGSSHQNVKQVALKLEQKGLLKMEKDKSDARATRLALTEKSDLFWASMEEKAVAFTQCLFEGIEKEDLSRTRTVLGKMRSNLVEMENSEVEGLE